MKIKEGILELVESIKRKEKLPHVKKYVEEMTVGKMLDYIKDQKIPRSAKVIVEHVHDVYLLKYHWCYYTIENEHGDNDIFLPPHNGFGSLEKGKYFVLWQHY